MQRYEDFCIPKIRPMWDGYHVLVHGYSQVLPREDVYTQEGRC